MERKINIILSKKDDDYIIITLMCENYLINNGRIETYYGRTITGSFKIEETIGYYITEV